MKTFDDGHGAQVYAQRAFPDGWSALVIPLTFGRARITLSRPNEWAGYEDSW